MGDHARQIRIGRPAKPKSCITPELSVEVAGAASKKKKQRY